MFYFIKSKIRYLINATMATLLVFTASAAASVIASPFETTTSLVGSPIFQSATNRFLSRVPINIVLGEMHANNIATDDTPFFLDLAAKETKNFVGYHGGCSEYRIFQDLIKCIVTDVLDIEVRNDFHFLRVPGEGVLSYNKAQDFLASFQANNTKLHDTIPDVRYHVLSLNISLFQSYNAPWDFTPRYYVENKSWTKPDFWNILLDFAEKVGFQRSDFQMVIDEAQKVLPRDRGMLIQFFDGSTKTHAFTDKHFYPSYSGGKSYGSEKPSYYLFSQYITEFPQFRLVINDQDVLNPLKSPLIMRRYDKLSKQERNIYEQTLHDWIRSTPVNTVKAKKVRKALLNLWK